jgi:hypothetical protein
MTECSPAGLEKKQLLRRDRILLPVLAFLAIAFLVGFTELIARKVFSRLGTTGEDCMVLDKSLKSLGGIPNSVCWEKIPEGRLTEYRFNSSGYRSDTEFGPKPPGTFRIVIIGSSFVAGARVPIEEAFATKLSSVLSFQTGRKVEILNMGMAGNGGYPFIVGLRFRDALAAKPDMILRMLAPFDIWNETDGVPTSDTNARSLPQESWFTKFLGQHSRASFALRHFLYESQSLYVKSIVVGGDFNYDTGFLRAKLSAEWKKQLHQFDISDAGIEERVKAAGVPLVAAFIPIRSQAAMISMGEWPAEFDPFKLGNELRSIIISHGGTYIDILPDYREIPNPERGYYPLEGHLNPRGHAIITRLLAEKLTSGIVPALSVSANSNSNSVEELGH